MFGGRYREHIVSEEEGRMTCSADASRSVSSWRAEDGRRLRGYTATPPPPPRGRSERAGAEKCLRCILDVGLALVSWKHARSGEKRSKALCM